MFSMDDNFTYVATLAVAVIVMYFARKYFKGGQFTEAVTARGKVAVVTGGNTGIGLETVRELNMKGAKVYMLCRSEQRAAAAMEELVKSGCDSSRLMYVNCDLGSKENIRKCAEKMSQLESRIDLLINNAGVWMGKYEKTKDGHEMTWGTNHLGPFLLTELLLPLIEKAFEGRIVNVSSVASHLSPALDLASIDENVNFNGAVAYSKSKLANVMHTRELTRRLRAKGNTCVTVNALHPGTIATELSRYVNIFFKAIFVLFRFFMKSRKAGAQTSLYCALSSDLKGVSGQYFSDCVIAKTASRGLDDIACKKLFDYSLQTVGLA